MLRKTLIVGSLLMAAGPVFAQNLLVNPGFDDPDQLTGWTCESNYGQASWSPIDSLGLAGSGSMQHDVAAALFNNETVVCRQCVPVSELWTYVMSGWHFWPDDPNVAQNGSVRWSMVFYSDTDCAPSSILGFPPATIGSRPPLALDTWHHLVSDEIMAPAGSLSARIGVVTWQNIADEPVRARLDDLDFSTTTVFRDGFETGNLTEWSASVP
jgi:hypothetical protein